MMNISITKAIVNPNETAALDADESLLKIAVIGKAVSTA